MRKLRKLVLALGFSLSLLSPSAWSFHYPQSAASPDREEGVRENLHRTYHQEMRDLERHLSGDLDSEPNFRFLFEQVKTKNKQFVEGINQLPTVDGTAATVEQAQTILDKIILHPVVGDTAIFKYDRDNINIGFCFGRAAYAHIELLRKGVHPKTIGKVFAMGKFLFPRASWDFHVATVFRNSKQEWWAIDTVTSKKVQPLEVWLKNVEHLVPESTHPLIRFYFTDAVKFQPLPGAYSPENLYKPYFHGFFRDLAKWFDRQPKVVN